jgi:hypothetical protein
VLTEHYPEAEKVVLVMDNLNTHTPASFYEGFRQSRSKPTSTVWKSTTPPSMPAGESNAEIVLSVLARQGLAHNITTTEDLWKPIAELAKSSQPASWHGELAIPHDGCAHQTETPLSRATI